MRNFQRLTTRSLGLCDQVEHKITTKF